MILKKDISWEPQKLKPTVEESVVRKNRYRQRNKKEVRKMPAVKLSRPRVKKDPISNIIRGAADDRGISLEHLARMTGVPYSTLCMRLQHPETFRRGELIRIYEVIDLPEADKNRIPW